MATLRIKEVIKLRGLQGIEVAARAGLSAIFISQVIANDTATLRTLTRISQAIGCSLAELIQAPQGYAHFYDPSNGEWLGIRKK